MMERLMAIAMLAALSAIPAEGVTKAAWFRETIPCAVGTKLAGYGPDDVSVAKNDDLMMCGVAVDDGRERVLLVSLDVLGLDDTTVRGFRAAAAKALGVPEAHVLLSCTHTHEGPHTRAYAPDGESGGEALDRASVEAIRAKLVAAAGRLADAKAWREVEVGFHSVRADENRNRRFTTADNCASFIAHRRALYGIATGPVDQELGTVALLDPVRRDPLYVIGNYAAHPLSAHSPGRGGLRISADFPGFYRRCIREDTGAEAMFVQGAAGDVVPKDDELGLTAARRTGENLAMASMASVIDIQRNAGRFIMSEPKVGGLLIPFRAKLRDRWRERTGAAEKDLELQVLSIGEVAFVGVPGEIVNEIGLEIKWNSPFKRTFIAYCATGYFGYMCPANLIAAGGYEAKNNRLSSRETLRMVAAITDGLFDLRRKTFPSEGDGRLDALDLPLVNLPGGVKGGKFDR